MKPPRRSSNPKGSSKSSTSRPSSGRPSRPGQSSPSAQGRGTSGRGRSEARGPARPQTGSRGRDDARGPAPRGRDESRGPAPRGRDDSRGQGRPPAGPPRGREESRQPAAPPAGRRGREESRGSSRPQEARPERGERRPAQPPPARVDYGQDRPARPRTFESVANQQGGSSRPRPEQTPARPPRIQDQPRGREVEDTGAIPMRSVFEERVWGRHAVLEHLRSGTPINRLFVLTTAQGLHREFFELAQEQGIPVVRSQKERLDYLASGGNHQGIVAQLGARAFATTDDITNGFQQQGRGGLLLVLSGVQDPGNLGAILRTAEGAGVQGVLLSARDSCGLTSTVSKISAGADAHMPVARADRLERLLEPLKDSGAQIVVTMPEADTPYYEVDFARSTVLVLGGEEQGVDSRLARLATHRVSIPMLGKIESLNVSAAAAAILYEAVRQRTR